MTIESEKRDLEKLATQIEALLVENNVGGCCILSGPNAACSFICLPKWTLLKFDQSKDEKVSISFENIKDQDERLLSIVNTLYFFSVVKEFVRQLKDGLMFSLPSFIKQHKKELDSFSDVKQGNFPTIH
jgi:hypothetical protein